MNFFLTYSYRLVSYRFSIVPQIRKVASATQTISHRYEEAISTLNVLQTNHSSLRTGDQRGKSMENIRRYLSLLNVQSDQIDQLNIIHVAGTKGKGSTCAFAESILRQYGYKTGFFSSPHLIEARERIRINGELLSKEKFVDYFWQCYNIIRDGVQQSTDENAIQMPYYFAFLTTMMFYVFVHEQIDVGIIEVGIGGEYDCTNVIKTPIVCGIASLGLDHVKLLGNTIEQIAWQKAGIFKHNVPAITVPQQPEAMHVLHERAEEKHCLLKIASPLNHYSSYPFQISLAGDVQEINASLAIDLVFHWLQARTGESYDQLKNGPLNKNILQGLATCQWLGRNQVVDTKNATYYLDGAHTIESMEQCKSWFNDSLLKQKSSKRLILLFYCSYDRQPDLLLQPLMKCKFDCVAFCSPITSTAIIDNNSETDKKLGNDQWRATSNMVSEIGRLSLHVAAFEKLWLSTVENQTAIPPIHCFHTVSQALEWIDDSKSSKPCVLVTGSLYLVGALLKLLDKTDGAL
ncbi:unnamed protein product [Rotaria magnacalcarata]|uniref:Folylpolyglutamate synthase n=1 Tax=Rotaria magnacalcarata TaxID=392030 RepID=A0A816N827_9BILA|nr:unnamed protein product [Rotaria magnacalcarata]CAF2148892.1 unnamed protein product [Rotaria magnacalcarata]